MMRLTLCCVLAGCMAVAAAGQVAQKPGDADMVKNYLFRLSDEAFARRQEARNALATQDQIEAYQKEMHAYFTEALGGFWEKGPLNATVVGSGTRDGYRYEKVMFESLPGMMITAVMYLPMPEGPYPGVIVPCGHDENGKANEAYQRLCILLARNGIAALIYDPIGQGERLQVLDDAGKSKYSCTLEHTVIGTAAIPLGWNTAKFRVWDGMRCIDYLTSRPDIIADKIGCTGNSGGGTLTSYIMALDPRVLCAAPSCYITSQQVFFKKDGPQDAEQNIHGQIARGMEHADYIMMRAPRPTLVCCATQDFFSIEGTWDSFRDAKRLYTKLGYAERAGLVEADEQHGFTLKLREGAARWMSRWLLGQDKPIFEQDAQVLTVEEAQCSPQGQVILMPGARTVFDVMREEEARLAAQRSQWLSSTPKDAVKAKIAEVAGIDLSRPVPEPELGPSEDKDGCKVQTLVFRPEEGISLPARMFQPQQARMPACLYVCVGGFEADEAAILAMAAEGRPVLAVEIRGTGKSTPKTALSGYDKLFGGGWRDAFTAYMLDKSYLGMQAEDIIGCGRWLAAKSGAPVDLKISGEGSHIHALNSAAMHAWALASDAFAQNETAGQPTSWHQIVQVPEIPGSLMATIHGALRWYDIPDLEKIR